MKNVFAFMFLLIFLLFSIFLYSLFSGTNKQAKRCRDNQEASMANQVSVTSYGSGSLITVKHNGHLFVVEGSCKSGAILHHPDCPCLTNNIGVLK